MLLKQLIESPMTASDLVVYDPFREPDRAELVREVIGLANADVEGPRNILFGVNPGAVKGSGIVGLSESVVSELKQAHRLISQLVEPGLQLAFIFDQINGKLVGALEIDGCDFGPYFVGQDFSEALKRGQCWIRDGRQLQSAERHELLGQRSPVESAQEEEEPVAPIENPDISVGFNEDPDCDYIELDVPDTSNPPFAEEDPDLKITSKLTQVIKDAVGTVTTRILRVGQRDDTATAVGPPIDLNTDESDDAGKVLAGANDHYFFEEKAIQLNLCLRNNGSQAIRDVRVEIGIPLLPDFDIADRLYTSPFDKRSVAEIQNLGYPDVERKKGAVFVRSKIGVIGSEQTEPAFRCALRLSVRPGMQKRKLGLRYKLCGPNDQDLGTGRLKIKFGTISS